MYPEWAGLVVVFFLVIWLLALSVVIFKQREFVKSLFPKSGERDIRRKFDEVLQSTESFKLELSAFKRNLERFEKESLGNLARVGFLRFNPYNDTGGDQSFVVALLDKKGDGFVLSSLHARSGTRVFAKSVKSGKSVRYELSKEEEEVIKKAYENNN